MSALYPIPRNCLIWLLASMFAVVVPLAFHLPVWLLAILMVCGFWRVMVFRERWQLPAPWLRMLLVLFGVLAILWEYGTLLGPDAGTALLVVGFSLKLLEMRQRRDAFVVVIMAYFVVITQFLFSQSLGIAAYMVVVLALITAAMLGLSQSRLHLHPLRTLKTSCKLLGISLPLMLGLFLLVPRIGPLWSLELQSPGARTGLSDEISPGDIARLSQSDELAFRATFSGPIPTNSELYWRGLVMSDFDGARWRVAQNADEDRKSAYWPRRSPPEWWRGFGSDAKARNYQVILEPTDQHWLFALDAGTSDHPQIGVTPDLRLIKRERVSVRFIYDVQSLTGYRYDDQLSPDERDINLYLPEGADSRTRRLASRWRAEHDSDSAYINRVLRFFAEQDFTYTLRPGVSTQNDRTDFFLFEQRRGFCSHYASAFAVLMRAAGIPTRLVGGYQGGEVSGFGDYVLVHQFDAHAWNEVWLEGQGWVRVDPTAAVSPDRVEQGLQEAVAGGATFLSALPYSPLRFKANQFVTRLRHAVDYINYQWYHSVVGYDRDQQREFLSKWLKEVNVKTLGLLVAGILLLFLFSLAFWLFFVGRTKHQDPGQRLYLEFCRAMGSKGCLRNPGEGPVRFKERLLIRFPRHRTTIECIHGEFMRLMYEAKAFDAEAYGRLKTQVRQLRFRRMN